MVKLKLHTQPISKQFFHKPNPPIPCSLRSSGTNESSRIFLKGHCWLSTENNLFD